MTVEVDSQTPQTGPATTSAATRETLLESPEEVKIRAAIHRQLGNPCARRSLFRESPYRETLERLHEKVDGISAGELLEEIARFQLLSVEATRKFSDPANPLVNYLAGVYSGLVDATGGRPSGMCGETVLITQLADCEANIILNLHNLPCADPRQSVNLEFHLGRAMATEHVLRKSSVIPTEVPPVPEYLH